MFTPQGGIAISVTQPEYSNNVWTGTATIDAAEENGTAKIHISGAEDENGNKMFTDDSHSFAGKIWVGTATIKDTMANGLATIKVSKAQNSYGNKMDADDDAGSFTIDTVPPVVSSVDVTPNPEKAGDITVTVVFTDATSDMDATVSPSVKFIPEGADSAIPVSQDSYDAATKTWIGIADVSDMAEGTATVTVRGATDKAKNVMVANDNAGTFTIDVTSPANFDLLSPANDSYVKSDGLTFSWDAATDAVSGVAKYQLYIDGSVISDISPDQTSSPPATPLDDGAYLWKVKAIDNAGNETMSDSIRRIFVDSKAPQTTLEIGEPKTIIGDITYIQSTTPLTLTAIDPVVNNISSSVVLTEYKLDAGDWLVYTAPFSITDKGEHTLSFRSKDKAGNLEEANTIIVNVGIAKMGDVDKDGEVTPLDATLILKHVVGTVDLLASTPLEVIDVSGDGSVSALDATLILQYCVGIIDHFPAQEN